MTQAKLTRKTLTFHKYKIIKYIVVGIERLKIRFICTSIMVIMFEV